MPKPLTLTLGGNTRQQVALNLAMANRHGLIAGATGTGKTVSLQILAEGFSRNGIPVFLADVKGDLSGLAAGGTPHRKIDERLDIIGLTDFQQRGYPTVFWDLYGDKGHPVRTTLSEFGPLLLANFLDLNDTQTGVLYTAFKVADDEGMLLLDLKDLTAMLNWIKEQRKALEAEYGGISPASVAAIRRKLLALEEQGGDLFFGEPALELQDLIKTDFSGNGVINVLDATQLIHQPRLYAIFLLWLISELFEQLPEVGDADKPKMVFFFDEAHLLFNNAPQSLLEKIDQVVRLIRSKGVGIYFISQSPADIPESVLGQLGNRVQHALRAFTPKDKKAVRVAAQTFRPNPEFSTEAAITQLGVGEALVSVLDSKGSPTVVERALIVPPESRMGPLDDNERQQCLERSPYRGRYDKPLDRESAYELLKARSLEKAAEVASDEDKPSAKTARGGRQRQGIFEAMAKSVARSIGSSLGRQIARGLLGSILGKR
ncbi:MAG TPA: ATP-binding protein [Porticoccaceae bacterium]|nr:ATP-binding protein [Porticoccaceae bacterium]